MLNTFTGDAETEDERRAFVEGARELAREARAAGIRLCIETDSNLMPTAEAGIRLLDEIGDDWVQINYDPGNVVYYAGARPEDVQAARSALQSAQARLNQMLEGGRPEDIASAQANLEAAQAKLDQLLEGSTEAVDSMVRWCRPIALAMQ